MSYLFRSLYAKIALVFLLLAMILYLTFLLISKTMSARYSQEVMQILNRSVAMYISDQEPIMINGVVNEAVVDQISSRAMVLNPSLEIYVLDNSGRILSHRLPADEIALEYVSLHPVEEFLSQNKPFPILGQDPRGQRSSNIFSASPIMYAGVQQGYVYTIVGGKMYRDLQSETANSYALRIGLMWMLGGLLCALILGGVLFFYLTRRLSLLAKAVVDFDLSGKADSNQQFLPKVSTDNADEIDVLNDAFVDMTEQIRQQFNALKAMDETRRELVANVSHDLRTPLASMQGYLETLLIRHEQLSQEDRQKYIRVAFKHSQRLNQLVGDLFELAKLEAGGVTARLEPFSLLELIHDCAQDFSLAAQKKSIEINVKSDSKEAFVIADIALIQRVLQNLVENALRHTPSGGEISIRMTTAHEKIQLEVEDTGSGIQDQEIPLIFERFFHSQKNLPSENIGTGLGLAIVKRILDLHKTQIEVFSEIDKGTRFTFCLPLQIAQP